MNFITKSLPPGDRDERRIVEPMIGHELVIRRINQSLADAVSWAIQMRVAQETGDEAAMQRAAGAIHTNCQTAQCLSHMIERNISKSRRRRPHE